MTLTQVLREEKEVSRWRLCSASSVHAFTLYYGESEYQIVAPINKLLISADHRTDTGRSASTQPLSCSHRHKNYSADTGIEHPNLTQPLLPCFDPTKATIMT
jgi:hypothetical protein